MNINTLSLAHVSDDQLLFRVKELAGEERAATARLLAHLAEMEERRLHCREGCSSLFSYCVEVLHLSEPAAYRRVKAARLGRRFPVVLDMLADGSIHLAGLDVLAAHLTEANHFTVLTEARYKAKREVGELAARLRPLPDAPPVVRKLPEPALGKTRPAASPVSEGTITNLILETGAGEETQPGSRATVGATVGTPVGPRPGDGRPTPPPSPPSIPDSNPAHRPVVAPLSPARYRIQFTAGAETYRKLQQVQELMRHRVPDGDPAAIVDTALTLLLEKLLREKTGAVAKPRPKRKHEPKSGGGRGQQPASGTGEAHRQRVTAGRPSESRHIPADVKRVVWKRDGGRCAFIAGNGRRCSSRGPLEHHHVEPYMLGGRATVGNIALRCRAHNENEGVLQFGKRRARVPGKHAPNTPKTLPGESSGDSVSGIGATGVG